VHERRRLSPRHGEAIIYPTGFRLSPYAETGSPGGAIKDAPRKLWHASQGSSGDWSSAGR
jgi:error-prone DNA polymerase